MKRKCCVVLILLVIVLLVFASCYSKKDTEDKRAESFTENTLAGDTRPAANDETTEAAGNTDVSEPDKTGEDTKTAESSPDETSSKTDGGGQTETRKPSETVKQTEPTAQEKPENPGGSIEAQISYYLNKLTLEEKICQMFVVNPEDLVNNHSAYTLAGEATKAAINKYPVGGVVYFDANLKSENQVKTMLSNTQKYSMDRIGLPMFLCVDEEGGKVARIAGSGRFGVPVFDNMCVIGAAGDVSKAYNVGNTIGSYLSRLGFNLDFAPVADVLSNPDNTVVKLRSFGSSPALVSNMTLAVSRGLNNHGVYSTYKHFPGHGATEGDTHEGYAYTNKSLEQLRACELVPFQNAINNGADFIMAAHISVPEILGNKDNTPASLSYKMITEVLRKQMGYNGIVVTDSVKMGAIAKNYTADEAVVKSVEAGVDIVLMPKNLEQAFNALLSAVKSGRISENRIDESAARILRIKLEIKKNM